MAAVLRIQLIEHNLSGDSFQVKTIRHGNESLAEFQHTLSAGNMAHFDHDMLRQKQKDGSPLRMISILKENSDLTAKINPLLIKFDKPIDITLSNPDSAKEVIKLQFETIKNIAVEPTKNEPFLFAFSQFRFPNLASILSNYSKTLANGTQMSEMVLVVKSGVQEVAINLSNASINQKALIWVTQTSSIDIRLEEHVFKLERDEAKMLQRLKETNLRATGVGGFLLEKGGPAADVAKNGTHTLDSLIDKKKIFESSRVVLTGQPVSIAKMPVTIEPQHLYTYQLGKEQLVLSYKTSQNSFTKMPKGRLRLHLLSVSQMSLIVPQQGQDSEYLMRQKDLIFKFNKIVGLDGEKLAYRLDQFDILTTNIDFDTAFFDDFIQIAVYKNNSTASVNVVGKEKLYLRDLEFGQVNAVTICEEGHSVGTIFLTAEYTPIAETLIHTNWPLNLRDASQLEDKFEFFNDHLKNPFKDQCQFGHLTIRLRQVYIPLMTQGLKKKDENSGAQSNMLFMVKLRIGTENNCIFVGAPDRILDPLHEKMSSNIDSLNEKVYLEFYDVLDEQRFNPKDHNSNNPNNLKLLALKIFDVKDFAFDANGLCQDHRVLVPVDRSGNVAQFVFDTSFTSTVAKLKMAIEPQQPYVLFMKMIQTPKQVMHHKQELDVTKMILVVKNATQNEQFQKKIFFNREMLSLGYVPISLGDTVVLTFLIKGDYEQLQPFSTFEFRVDNQGLVQLTTSINTKQPAPIQLRTWEANIVSLPVNFSKNNTYTQKLQKQNTLAAAIQPNKSDILLENILIEFEVRQSDFINLASKTGHLESATLGIRFDRESLVDLIMARDISEQALFQIQMVSDDQRSIRQKKKFLLSEFDFDSEVRLTMFTLDDVVQISVHDENDFFVTLELNELPLTIQKEIQWFLQVGSKQIKIDLWLDQDVTLLPAEEQKVDLTDLNLNFDLMQKMETMKAQEEFQLYMSQVRECKNQQEQLAMLKQMLTNQTLKNRKLTTKQLKSKKDTEKILKTISDAESTSAQTAKPFMPKKETNFEYEFRNMVSSTAVKKSTQPQQKNLVKQMVPLCACGEPNPQHRGYCTQCVVKMKSKFDALISKYEILKEEFENFNTVDAEKANEKLKLMRAKAEQYEISLNDAQMLDIMEQHAKLMGTDDRKKIAELKVEVLQEKQEQEILLFKQRIEQEDFIKQQKWFEEQIQLKVQAKKNQESESAKFLYDYDTVKNEIDSIEKRCYLKKRYVTQYRALRQREMERRQKVNKK